MPAKVVCEHLPLAAAEAESIWQQVRRIQKIADAFVEVSCVSEFRMRELNNKYRGHDRSTNVLTFIYKDTEGPTNLFKEKMPEHEVVLCLDVARREAATRLVSLRDYVALLLAHAFLHVAGLDHEESQEAAAAARAAERLVLNELGFSTLSLWD